MKNYTQVYVENSLEAVALYCEAFGAEVTFAMKNEAGDAYEHCELSVNGEPFLAAAEARNPCDISVVHHNRWQTMTFILSSSVTAASASQFSMPPRRKTSWSMGTPVTL